MTTPDPNDPKPNDAARMLNYRTQPREKPNYKALGQTFFGFIFGALMGCGLSFVALALFLLVLNLQGDMNEGMADSAAPFVCCVAPASILILLTSLIVRMQWVKGGEFAAADTAVFWGAGYVIWLPWFGLLAHHFPWVSFIACWVLAVWFPGFPIVSAFWLYRRKVFID